MACHLSIAIPFRNDFDEIGSVIDHLTKTATGDDYEILIYNDGSFWGDTKPRPLEISNPKVRVINNDMSFGVGYAFDRAVEQAKGDIIILMGSDVYPMGDWYSQVVNAVQSNPSTLGCSVCVGINPQRTDPYDPKNFRRYGSDLLFYVDTEDLPKTSALRNRKGGYTDLFKAKWLMGKQSDEPYEIPCVLGAFYFTTKEYYQRIGGFDTETGNSYRGHRVWSHLEPHISLKSWLVGGGCTLYPHIEAAHVFARVTETTTIGRRRPRVKVTSLCKGGRSEEWMYWNVLWILETCILDDKLRQKLYNFLHTDHPLELAKKMIRDHYGEVKKGREANRLKFTRDHTIFTEKFNYDFNI